MKVDRPELRKQFNAARVCEWCDKKSPQGCDCCHIFTKGAGQVDVRANLFAAHRLCHSATEGKKVCQDSIIEIVADRERMTTGTLVETVHFWRRLPKGSMPSVIFTRAFAELSRDGFLAVLRDVDEMAAEGFWSTGKISS